MNSKKANHMYRYFFIFYVIFLGIVLFMMLSIDFGYCMGWPEVKTRLLPDEAFAFIESDGGSRIRHCPHHDLNGYLDTEQMIFVLGAIDNEIWLDPTNKTTAEAHLQKHYDRFKTKAMKKGLNGPLNINEATLADLVLLPQVGPVLAVKIAEYRNTRSLFATIEDIKNVEGIGQGTFNALRYYIFTE